MADRDGKRVLLNPNGQLVQVSPTEVEDRLATGLYSEPSAKQIAAYDAVAQQDLNAQRASEMQSAGAMLETGVKTGLNAFAAPLVWGAKQMGLGDIRDIGMSPEEAAAYHEREAKLAEYNPVSAFAGEVGGQLVGLKGAGMVARGVNAATGGALTLGRLGAATAEGAYLGASQAMEDPDAAAEHVLASGALGAVLGGGTHAVFGAASNRLAQVFGKLGAEVPAAGEGEVTSSTIQKLKNAYNSWTSRLTGADKSLLEEVGPFGARRAEAETAAHTLDESINKTALKMQPLITQVDDNVSAITRTVRESSMKEENLRRVAGESFETPARLRISRALVGNTYENVVPGLQALEEFEAANPEVRIPAQTRRELNALRNELKNANESAGGEKATAISNYILANGIKQKLDTVVVGLREDANKMAMGMSHMQAANMREVANVLQKAADDTREALMNESLWGKPIASAQREVNEIWHGGAIKSLNNFGKNFMRNTGEVDYQTGRSIFENDPSQTARALRSLGTPEGFISERAMGDYVEHVGKLVDKIADKYEMSGEQRQLVDTTLKQINELKTHFSSIKEQSGLASKYTKMAAIERQHSGIANQLPLLGGVLGGPVGAGIGAIARQALQPQSSGQMIAALGRSVEKIGSMTNGVGTWLSKGAGAVTNASNARNAGVSAALQLWRGSHKTDQTAFQERSKAVLSANPGDIGPHVEELPPAVQVAAGGQAARALQFLQTILPANAGSPSIMAPGRKVPASVPDQLKFAKAWATVIDPSTAVKDLKRGQLSPIQVQTLKSVYPRIYDGLRMSVLQGIAQADDSGLKIPIHTRQQLGLLLDLQGAGQPAFSDAIVGIVQNAMMQQAQQKPQARPPSQQLSKSMMSPSQELAT